MLPARFAGSVFFLATVAVFAAATQETAPDQAERSSPFSVGERLVYRIQWDPPWYIFFLPAMDAGEAELQLNSDREHNGRKVLMVNESVGEMLDGITLDTVDTPEGRRLAIHE